MCELPTRDHNGACVIHSTKFIELHVNALYLHEQLHTLIPHLVVLKQSHRLEAVK